MNVIVKVGRLNETLYRQGMTKRALARRAGIGQVTAQQVCNGHRNPSAPVAKKIVDALGVAWDEIFSFEEVNADVGA